MKKTLAVFLVVIIIASLTFTGYAETNSKELLVEISKDKALEVARKFVKTGWNLEIDKEKKVVANLNSDYSNYGGDNWMFHWIYKEEDYTLYVDVTVDSVTGVVERVAYDKYPVVETPIEKIEIIKFDEAKNITERFLRKVNYSLFKQCKFRDYDFMIGYSSKYYELTYTRQYNGKFVGDNNIQVKVDAVTKEIKSYKLCWDNNAILKPVKSSLTDDKLNALLQKALNMQLTYRYLNKYDPVNKELALTYNTNLQNAYVIDAENGVILNNRGSVIEIDKSLDITDEQKNEIYAEVAIPDTDEPISEEVATYFIKSYLEYLYGENISITKTSYEEDQNPVKKFWRSEFLYTDSSNKDYDGFIYIDALTSQLLNVRLNVNDINLSQKVTDEQWKNSYDKAIDIITKLYPHKIKEIKTNQTSESKNNYGFVFTRMFNGIKYPYNGLVVLINPEDLTLLQFQYSWHEVDFPSQENTITAEDAFNKYLEGYKFEPVYARITTGYDLNNDPVYEYRLVSEMPENYLHGNVIHALDGSVLNVAGNKYIANQKHANITKEVAIAKIVRDLGLNQYNISDFEEPLFLDIEKDYAYYKDLKYAIYYKLIDNQIIDFNGSEKITRIELCKLIIKALKYDKLANISSLYKVSFADSKLIAEEDLGYAAICDALGIIKAENKRFRPNDFVSDIDLEIALYNLQHYKNQ